ncbi:MAG: methyltransferase regulatory domain-containing protein, partial [Planctomycetia bacterium]
MDNNCQEKILDICNKTLTPNGIAYISYNVMPGWRMRGMLRDMMIYHVSKFNDRQSKIYQARALLQFLANSVQGDKNPYGIFLQSELELLRAQNDSYLYHDFLEENNEPCYFHQFVSRCEKHGLAYLGDSDPRTMSTRDMPEQAQKHLSQTISLVETEQYMDFIRNRMFRMSLITRKGKQPVYSVNPSCVQNMYISSSLTSNEPNLNILATEQASFTCQNGVVMGVGEPLLKAALLVMQKAWPSSVPAMEILEKASAMMGLKLPTDAQALGQLVFQLGQMMVTAYTSMPIGSVDITTRPITGIHEISSKPKVFGFIAHQAATLGAVTNIRHQIIRVGDFEKAIINYLDGTKDQEFIVKALLELVKNQTITIQENGSLATPERAEVVLR